MPDVPFPQDILNYCSNEQLAKPDWDSFDIFDTLDGTHYVFITNLAFNTTYYWQVRAVACVTQHQTAQNYVPTFNGTLKCVMNAGVYDDTHAGWVYVDGNKVTTPAGAFQWQKSYTSPPFAYGTHVLEVRNAGGGGCPSWTSMPSSTRPSPNS